MTGKLTPAQYFQHWIRERHSIHLRRVAGSPYPWSKDKILTSYRFCNVYRELDKVTAWMDQQWYPDINLHKLPFRAVVGRMINGIEQLEAVNNAFDPGGRFCGITFKRIMTHRRDNGLPLRGGAYIVSTNGATASLGDYLSESVFKPMLTMEAQDKLTIRKADTLSSYGERLSEFQGMGSFMVGQVVADLKHHHPTLMKAPDYFTYVAPGPGSRRGLRRLLGGDVEKKMGDKEFFDNFRHAEALAQEVAAGNGWPRLCAQNIQNCLCEFDKYMRAVNGTGKPKQGYTPSGQQSLL